MTWRKARYSWRSAKDGVNHPAASCGPLPPLHCAGCPARPPLSVPPRDTPIRQRAAPLQQAAGHPGSFPSPPSLVPGGCRSSASRGPNRLPGCEPRLAPASTGDAREPGRHRPSCAHCARNSRAHGSALAADSRFPGFLGLLNRLRFCEPAGTIQQNRPMPSSAPLPTSSQSSVRAPQQRYRAGRHLTPTSTSTGPGFALVPGWLRITSYPEAKPSNSPVPRDLAADSEQVLDNRAWM